MIRTRILSRGPFFSGGQIHSDDHVRGRINYPFPKQALVFTCLQYKSFENTVGIGEIARYEQFLLFPQCFLPIWITFFTFSSNLKLLSAKSFSLEESKI